MGQKTTAFMTSIASLADKCATELGDLKKVLEGRKALGTQAGAQIKILDTVAERIMPGGTQFDGCEEKVENDPTQEGEGRVGQDQREDQSGTPQIAAARSALATALNQSGERQI